MEQSPLVLQRDKEQCLTPAITFSKKWVFARLTEDVHGMACALLEEVEKENQVFSVFFYDACNVTRNYFRDIFQEGSFPLDEEVYDVMFNLLSALVERFPGDPLLQKDLLFCVKKKEEIEDSEESKIHLAGVLFDKASYYEAMSVYADVMKKNPKNIDAIIGVAQCFYELGNISSSEETLLMAAHLEKNDPRLFFYFTKISLQKIALCENEKDSPFFFSEIEVYFQKFLAIISGFESVYLKEREFLVNGIVDAYLFLFSKIGGEFSLKKALYYLELSLSFNSDQRDIAELWVQLKNSGCSEDVSREILDAEFDEEGNRFFGLLN